MIGSSPLPQQAAPKIPDKIVFLEKIIWGHNWAFGDRHPSSLTDHAARWMGHWLLKSAQILKRSLLLELETGLLVVGGLAKESSVLILQ